MEGVDRGDPCPSLTFPSEALPPPALGGESARGNPVVPVSGNGTGRKCRGEVPGEEEAGSAQRCAGRGRDLCSPREGRALGSDEGLRQETVLTSCCFITVLLSHVRDFTINQGLFYAESCFSGPKLL